MTRPEIEHIGPHLIREAYKDRIMILTIKSLTHANIDLWYKTTDEWYTQVENLASVDARFSLMLHDFSPTQGAATPYSRARAQDLVLRHPTLKGRSAIVIAHALYVQMLTQHLISHLEGNIERQTFHDREVALRWLEAWL